jgi:mono/diheme cytochrome c family protein
VRKVVALLALVMVCGWTWAGYALAARGAGDPRSASAKMDTGRRLYRKYCGHCHALREAHAAGFAGKPKLGQEGGPNFNNLRIPFGLSVSLLTQASAGHELFFHRLKWAEIRDVSRFVATATKDHPVLAHPTDG